MSLYQSTPGRSGSYRQPVQMRSGALRRREPTAYLIATLAQQRRDPYASLRGVSRELAGMRMAGMGMGEAYPTGVMPAASSAAIAGGTAAGLIPVALIPFIGPIVAGVTFGLSKLFNRKAGGQKIAATQIVDEAERAMIENRDGFLAGPRTESSKAQALANFDAAWQYIKEGCGNPELADAGRRCISERQRGGVYDYFAAYRDPISAVAATADPSIASSLFGGGGSTSAGGGAFSFDTGGASMNPLIWLVGGGALIWYAMSR